jgi:hypothetical protein
VTRNQSGPYILISGCIFGAVALAHLLRALYGWTFVFGPWGIPAAGSWVVTVVAGGLFVWALRLVRRGG